MGTQSKTVDEILLLRNEQAGQFMGYRHNTRQDETIVNATFDMLLVRTRLWHPSAPRQQRAGMIGNRGVG